MVDVNLFLHGHQRVITIQDMETGIIYAAKRVGQEHRLSAVFFVEPDETVRSELPPVVPEQLGVMFPVDVPAKADLAVGDVGRLYCSP